MKKKFIVLGTLLVIIVLLFIFKKPGVLSSSFTMKLHGDFTSSGAGRKYEAILKFTDKKLAEGTATYDIGDINGEQHYECTFVNQQWVYTKSSVIPSASYSLNQQWIDNHPDKTGSGCDLYINDLSTNAGGVENNIKSGAIKPVSSCGHDDMCYELTY